jgi:hypothetical protein
MTSVQTQYLRKQSAADNTELGSYNATATSDNNDAPAYGRVTGTPSTLANYLPEPETGQLEKKPLY